MSAIIRITLLGLLLSCGDDDATDTVPVGTIDERLAEVACEIYATCPFDESSRVPVAFAARADRAACVAAVLPDLREVSVYEAHVAAGTVRYHPEALDACLAAARERCSLVAAIECRAIFEGIGTGACFDDRHCGGDTFCDKPLGSACGTCLARSALGEACIGSNACSLASGLTSCDGVSGTCVPAVHEEVALGARCGVFTEDGIEHTARCALAASCVPELEVEGAQCKPRVAVGGACGYGVADCVADAICVADVCEPLTISDEIGAPCGSPFGFEAPPFTVCNAFAGLYCDDGACAARPPGVAGDTCSFETFGFRCADGFYCDTSETGICAPRRAVGEPCDTPAACLSDACDDGRCADPSCR